MAYSLEIKNNVRERLEKGQKAKAISKELEISISTIYNWKKEWDKENKSKELDNGEKETSKEIRRLIKLRQFNEALRLIGKYPNDKVIQSQRITILIHKGNLEEAKRIGNREEFRNYAPIQSQMITIAIKEKNFEEAKRIGNKEEFRNNASIQSQMITIEINDSIAKSFNIEENRSNQPLTEELKFLNRIKTKIYYDKIERRDIDEIENNKDITDYERIYLLLAVYEKQKEIKKARELVKKYKAEYKEAQDNKTLNGILQRIESKKAKIFDIGFYDEILHWEIDEDLKEEYEQEMKKESESKRELGEKRTEKQARVIRQEVKKEYRYTTIKNNRKKYTKSESKTRR